MVPQCAVTPWSCSYDHLAFLCLCYKVLLLLPLAEQDFAYPNQHYVKVDASAYPSFPAKMHPSKDPSPQNPSKDASDIFQCQMQHSTHTATFSHADQSDNCCSDPTNEDGPEVSSLYGQCIFSSYTGADMALTMEVQAAAEAASFPARYDSCLRPLETVDFS